MMTPLKITLGVICISFAALTALGSFYVVSEGHIGIKTRFSRAVEQVDPGLHLKVPFIESVKKIEVRERKNVEELSAATANQLPITATVSVNWTVQSESALDLFVLYGGLDQFESRILDPKLRQAAKSALAEFSASELIRNRTSATGTIQEKLVSLMEPYPVTVNSPQIENVILPPQYMDAILAKEKAREDAVKERHTLEQQKLQAQQLTQTAEAERDATMARADGNAYRVKQEAAAEAEAIRLKGEAEAQAANLLQEALSDNPLLVQYEQAKRWGGKLPTTVMGGGSNIPIIMSMPSK